VDASQPKDIRDTPRLSADNRREIDKNVRGKLREMVLVFQNLVWPVYRKLQELDLLQNTYIILDADNGWHSGEHRLFKKGKPYSESLDTPLLVVGGGIPAGTKETDLAATIDIPSTFVDMGGADLPVDGWSLAPYLRGDAPAAPRKVVYCEHQYQNWNLIIDDRLYKTVQRLNSNEVEYYDLLEAPLEVHSRHEQYEAEVARKVAKMKRMIQLSGDDIRAEDLTYN
jgi:arylsulfatase A-like enzyme